MKKYFKQKKNGHQVLGLSKGFTLVETLVSISIFTMSILGLLSVLSSGVTSTSYAKNKIIAGYLAQEGIEYVRNMRDTFVIYDATSAQNGWSGASGFITKLTNASCYASNGCYFGDLSSVDYSNPSQPMKNLSMTACGGSCPALTYSNTSGKYSYDVSGTATNFIRKIQVNTISANEIKILSTVSWTQGLSTYSITFSENLYNWIE